MNNIFCYECGGKHSYTYSKPKFCSSCGVSFSALKPQAKKISKRNEPEPNDFEDEDDDEFEDDDSSSSDFSNSTRVPKIRSLAVDIESEYDGISSFKLGSLFGQNSSQSSSRRKSTQNIEDFIEKKRVR